MWPTLSLFTLGYIVASLHGWRRAETQSQLDLQQGRVQTDLQRSLPAPRDAKHKMKDFWELYEFICLTPAVKRPRDNDYDRDDQRIGNYSGNKWHAYQCCNVDLEYRHHDDVREDRQMIMILIGSAATMTMTATTRYAATTMARRDSMTIMTLLVTSTISTISAKSTRSSPSQSRTCSSSICPSHSPGPTIGFPSDLVRYRWKSRQSFGHMQVGRAHYEERGHEANRHDGGP